MRNESVSERVITFSVDALLEREPPDVQRFYRQLSDPERDLSWKSLSEIAPVWGTFIPVVKDGIPIAYVRPDYDIRSSDKPWIIMPNGPSTGGKSTLVRSLLEECGDCMRIMRTCTTRALQPDEHTASSRVVINADPLIDAGVSLQYFHITKQQFTTLIEKGFFAEHREMWSEKHHKSRELYGIPQSELERAGKENTPFWFLVVDEMGQKTAITWIQTHLREVNSQTWFLLPTKQTFSDLKARIIFQRTNQAAERIVDAARDLLKGVKQTDLIIPYPYDRSGIPHEALSNTKELMNMLHPGIFAKK